MRLGVSAYIYVTFSCRKVSVQFRGSEEAEVVLAGLKDKYRETGLEMNVEGSED